MIKKISWFKRIFMSWNKLLKHFDVENNSQNIEDVKKISFQEAQIKGLEAQLNEKEKSNDILQKTLEDKNAALAKQEKEITRFEEQLKNKETNSLDLKSKIANFQMQEKVANNKLESIAREKQDLEKNIAQKLETLHKIEKTFFGASGNKGKGELGELQLKSILEHSGITNDFWTENLPVGSKNVEFAIKSGHPDKWIPVDSKVLEPEYDGKKPIINTAYEKNVLKQAKKVAEYLGKKNTASHGLLVLQNDEIYFKLYEAKPNLFTQVIRDHKIYITSPSLFTQFAFSISHIIDIYNKVNGEEEVYIQLIKTLNNIQKFAKSIGEAYKKLKTSVETHLPAIERGYEKARVLDQGDKLKPLNLLNEEK